jgi:hypothetical protein
MDDLTYYSCDAIVGFTYLFISAHLYARSRGSGAQADRLLSWSFLLFSLGYLAYDVPFLYLGDESRVPAVCTLFAFAALDIGIVVFACFIRNAFRSEDRWASWLVAGIAICVAAGVLGSEWMGDPDHLAPRENPWYWAEMLGATCAYLWMGWEGTDQYRKARRRRQLGLCTPLVCNRYLMWGLTGWVWTGCTVAITAQTLAYDFTGIWFPALDYSVTAFELVPAALVWLIFHPPRFYRHWIQRGVPAAPIEAGT